MEQQVAGCVVDHGSGRAGHHPPTGGCRGHGALPEPVTASHRVDQAAVAGEAQLISCGRGLQGAQHRRAGGGELLVRAEQNLGLVQQGYLAATGQLERWAGLEGTP